MKFLLAPLGSRGDVQPQLVLGEELSRRGHRVTLAAPPNFRKHAEERGYPFVPIGGDIERVLEQNSVMTEQHPLRALPAQLALLRRQLTEQVGDMFRVRHDADLVVAAGLGFAGRLVADQLKVPHVFCCYSLAAMPSAAHAPAVTPLFGLPRIVNRGLWLGVTALFDAALGTKLNELRRGLGLPALARPWFDVHAAEAMLAQDGVLGELPADVAGRAVHVPALVRQSDPAARLPDLLERFLRGAGDGSSAAAPVVYLGFGSMPSLDRRRVVALAVELFERHGARVILYSPRGEEEGADLPAGVFATGDTDHGALLSRVDLIVHHGGAGTTASALRSGVPQLIVPHIVDQFFHGRRIAELGLGPAPVPKAQLGADAVAQALRSRFQYWSKAQSIRAAVAPEGGARRAADHLEALVRAHRSRQS